MADALLLEPLPETVMRWEAAGHPDVLVEVREELTCTLVGTVELRWRGPAEASPVVRVRAVVDHRSPDHEGPTLAEAVRRAERARRRSIRPCADCGEPTPPEHATVVDGVRVCHGCASAHHGVVY